MRREKSSFGLGTARARPTYPPVPQPSRNRPQVFGQIAGDLHLLIMSRSKSSASATAPDRIFTCHYMPTENASRDCAEFVARINAKIAPRHFLVARRERSPGERVYAAGRWLVSYWLAEGSPTSARYEVLGAPVDLAEMAQRLGLEIVTQEAA